jgi:hypothetical protein
MDNTRVEYLESLLPMAEKELEIKYFEGFEKYATYTGNGTYQWQGIRATDTRELWLMGILHKEKIDYKQE